MAALLNVDRTAAFGPLRTARFARTDGRSDWKASDERQKYQTRLPFGPIVGDPQIEVDIHPPSPMPGNIQHAIPSGVMPYALCTAFSESREYAHLQAQYHDGTVERSQLAQTSRRTFALSHRLTAVKAIALRAFWDGQQGGVVPFLFYNLVEGPYDSTGNSTQGRYTVVFRNNWNEITGLARTDVQQLQLIEVA